MWQRFGKLINNKFETCKMTSCRTDCAGGRVGRCVLCHEIGVGVADEDGNAQVSRQSGRQCKGRVCSGSPGACIGVDQASPLRLQGNAADRRLRGEGIGYQSCHFG